MARRKLGATGLTVPEIGFGCGPTARLMVEGNSNLQLKAVTRALELGIDYFDTAPGYGDGRSEIALGGVLAALGARPILATKVVLEADDFGDIGGRVNRSITRSLERLRTDHLHIVHLHNRVGPIRAAKTEYGSGAVLTPDDILGKNGVLEALQIFQANGTVGVLGCCGYGGTAAELAKIVDNGGFGSILVNYSMANPSAWMPFETDRDYKGIGLRAAQRSMGVVGLRVLEAGLLARPVPNDASGRLAALSDMSENRSLLAPAIRYVLANPDVSTVLLGFSDVDQIEAAATIAARGPLAQADLDRIAAL